MFNSIFCLTTSFYYTLKDSTTPLGCTFPTVYIYTCELVDHFGKHRDHDFEKDLSVTIIEQLKSTSFSTAQKKELLRKERSFWQAKLKTLAPHGLNTRLGQLFQKVLTCANFVCDGLDFVLMINHMSSQNRT